MNARRAALLLWAWWLALAAAPAHTATIAPTEQQLKAVFVFNFSHFVTWPPETFITPDEPFVIGILGSDAFAAQVEEAIRDEHLDTHPLVVRRFNDVDEMPDCRILYIDRSHAGDVQRVLEVVDHRETLTVSDLDDAAMQGVIIQLATDNNRIRLLINADAAQNAGLTISSNLLRLAQLAHTGD